MVFKESLIVLDDFKARLSVNRARTLAFFPGATTGAEHDFFRQISLNDYLKMRTRRSLVICLHLLFPMKRE